MFNRLTAPLRLPVIAAAAMGLAASAWAPTASAAIAHRAPNLASRFPSSLQGHLPPVLQRRLTGLMGPVRAAQQPDFYFFDTNLLKVTSSTGKTLYLNVSGSFAPGSPTARLSVNLSKNAFSQTGESNNEYHYWSFTVPLTGSGNSTVMFPNNNIDVNSNFGPYGSLKISSTHGSSSNAKCQSGSEKYYRESAQATLTLNTKNKYESSKWGGVSGKFSFPESSLSEDFQCIPVFPNYSAACISGGSWDQSQMIGSNSESFGGSSFTENGQSYGYAFASRMVALKGLPTNVTGSRDDEMMDGGISQKFSKSAANPHPLKAEIGPAANTDQYMHGGATLTAAKSTTDSSGSCKLGKTTKTQYDSFPSEGPNHTSGQVTYTNGSRKLKAVMHVGPKFTIPNQTGTNGDVLIYSYK